MSKTPSQDSHFQSWPYQVLGWVTYACLMAGFFGAFVRSSNVTSELVINACGIIALSFPLLAICSYVLRTRRSLITTVFFDIALSVLFGLCVSALSLEWLRPFHLIASGTLSFRFFFDVVINSLVLAFSCSLSLLHQTYSEQISQARSLRELESTTKNAQLTALRYQIQPHYLFNALNAISSLVVAGQPQEARQLIGQLSSLLRGMLDDPETHFTELSTELDHAREYLEIQRARFGQKLDAKLDVEVDDAEIVVPRWLLIPLVENAVMYGLSARQKRTEVLIQVRTAAGRVFITVQNFRGGRASSEKAEKGFGIGLSNTRGRLRAIYGGSATLTTEDLPDLFVVHLDLPTELSAIEAQCLVRHWRKAHETSNNSTLADAELYDSRDA